MSRDPGQLRDEIALREASLADAARELDAGELSLEQFATIAQRETPPLDQARRDLEALHLAPAQTPSTKHPRVRQARWLVLAILCFAVVLGFVLYAAITPRQAGNSETGSLSLAKSQQIEQLLSEAEADVANGDPVAALSAYRQVLSLDSSNVAALTQSGWLDFSAGSASHQAVVVEVGIKNLEKAVALAPRQAAPRLYLGIVAASTPGNGAVAKSEFEVFLTLKPSVGQMAIARPFLQKLGLIGP
jgi:hypothetical protein